MENLDRSSGPNPDRAETIVLEGLRCFFADPRHFERVLFSVRRSTSQLAQKLEQITDELIAIDQQSDHLTQSADRILAKIASQKIAADVGAAILGSTHDHLRQLHKERAALEVHEASLGKEIRTLEAFERDRPWCRLYPPQRRTEAGNEANHKSYV
jgi:hypothetical protein